MVVLIENYFNGIGDLSQAKRLLFLACNRCMLLLRPRPQLLHLRRLRRCNPNTIVFGDVIVFGDLVQVGLLALESIF